MVLLCYILETIDYPGDQNVARRRVPGAQSRRRRRILTLSHPEPKKCHGWITHDAWVLPDPKPARIPARSAEFGQLRRCSAAGTRFRRQRRRPPRTKHQSRPIRSHRPRLDLGSFKSEPLDQDLTTLIRAYRFGLYILLKSPSVFLESTRSPDVFKTNSRSAQNFARTPLSFPRIEPDVQACHFCTLDPRTNV